MLAGMHSAPLPVVALVASAGGLAAIGTVLAGLPPGFPGAVIALQHLSPEHPSMLVKILQRSSALPVEAARDGDLLVCGRVLVAPPGLHTLVTPDLRVSLVHSGSFPPSRPSADLLLTTLALACGSSAIAVVMTGGGQDGATGATVIHKHGGTVLATDQATSHTFSMPAATIERDSIRPTVAAVDDVADALARLVLRSTA
jgi:two-component system chemotaxis response regulator CheB